MVEVLYRKICELDGVNAYSRYDDPNKFLLLPTEKVLALKSNPYAETDSETAQILGVVGNTIIGHMQVFPVLLSADNHLYKISSGSSLFVDAQFRNTGFGMDINTDYHVNLYPSKCVVVSGLSHLARKVFRLIGSPVFGMQQFAYIKKSGAYWRGKVCPKLAAPLACVSDCLLLIYRKVIALNALMHTRSWKIVEIRHDDLPRLKEVVEIIQEEKARFSELHDERWFRWVLTCDFHGDARTLKHLYGVYKNGEMIGFFLNNAKDGRSGKTIEWGLRKGFWDYEPWLLLRAAEYLIDQVDQVVLCVTNNVSISKFRKLLFYPILEEVVVLNIGEDSPIREHKGYDKSENWRLRPGMGDVPFY